MARKRGRILTGRPSPEVVRVAGLLRLAAGPTAAGLLLALAEGECHVGALAEGEPSRPTNVSSTLARLGRVGLVDRRREGQRVYYSLTGRGRAVVELVRRMEPGA